MPCTRRRFLGLLSATVLAEPVAKGARIMDNTEVPPEMGGSETGRRGAPITLFLCGDVMTGRGIDQVLPHPAPPRLHETYVKDAREYVVLAERTHGPIRRPAEFDYPWGAALAELARAAPDVRIVNLETAVTLHEDWWTEKGIHYRMNPANLPCLGTLGPDCAVLANNHVLDWSYRGLADTLAVLTKAGIRTAGAGSNNMAARAPAVLDAGGSSRVLVFACGLGSSGIPEDWAAGPDRPGVWRLPDLSEATVRDIGSAVAAAKRPGDLAVASIHWGGNWGHAVPVAHRDFAQRLIDAAGIDLVHGHSSHHPLGMEIHRNKLILYGCGDFLNDYEGIAGHEEYRGDLVLMYFPALDPSTGNLRRLELVPLRIRRFRLEYPPESDIEWLRTTLDRQSRPLGGRVERTAEHRYALRPV